MILSWGIIVYTPASLQQLRERIDLVDLLSSHLDLKRSGSSYKGLCPFHQEKSPSFIVQRGDTHYHCFGCGAHGDAVAFLMQHLQLSFVDAIELLSERYNVVMEQVDRPVEKQGPSKPQLREVLRFASSFYHLFLLHSEEGRIALDYLYKRGLDLSFIKLFEVGLAPRRSEDFLRMMSAKGFSQPLLLAAGLLTERKTPFFHARITFPIRDVNGNPIAFSARKFEEEGQGPKYINTPETLLFKKSHTLYGLYESRKQIAKERKALIVEGQIDALRLIEAGFNWTVAGQGTAFGADQVAILLQLGVTQVFLALDGDGAGQTATIKIGQLFQKEGIDVRIVRLPAGSDPDSFLRAQGPEAFSQLIQKASDFLPFWIASLGDLSTPAAKAQAVEHIRSQIGQWNHPVMVHESLKKLSLLLQVPEGLVGTTSISIAKRGYADKGEVDGDGILEGELLRWLLLSGDPEIVELIHRHISPSALKHPIAQELFAYKPTSLMEIGPYLKEPKHHQFISTLIQRKVNLTKAKEGAAATIKKILERNWLLERERVHQKMMAAPPEEQMELLKEFNELAKSPPKLEL